ncbi:DUF6350 family protein [Cellulomonas sp. ATA003]|uniref:cell division protein PerM n=1 Tax=Cellulomonas sp. ATA003 TaxID=3073064 RepID=UPI00287391C5|nr:DUF6350 family protein [Cellulomonas sp. ATA003]WNB86080.1 DUF6350 family protein [Cellulomonas sp. ATA003]
MSGSSWGSAGTATLSRWGHRLLTAEDGSRRSLSGSVDGAPRWFGGLAAGLQAALLSLAVVVLPTVAAYVATSADPSNQDVGWLRSVAFGAGLWLLGHGAPLDVGDVRISLIPLGLTAMAVFACYASARRSGRPTWSGYGAGVAGYVAVALGVALLSDGGGALRGVVGAVCVSALGLGSGLLAQPGAPRLHDLSQPLWRRVPAPVRVGAAAGVMAVASLVVVACVVVAAWLLGSRSRVWAVTESLGVDVVGGTVLLLSQLALVPDLVMWALAYVVGPGFAVGAGTHLTSAEVIAGPLPALPLLAALPGSESATGAWSAWWPLLTVIAGAGVGWWVHTRLRRGQWWHPLVACLTTAAVAGLGAGVLVGLASGSAGPGRMTEVGGSGVLVGAAVALGTLIGAAVVALPFNPEVRSEASRHWRRVRAGDRVPTGAVPVVGPILTEDDATDDDVSHDASAPDAAARDASAHDAEPADDTPAEGVLVDHARTHDVRSDAVRTEDARSDDVCTDDVCTDDARTDDGRPAG